MAQITVPNTSNNVKTIAYENLLGVDYQSDATEVNRRRSPDMVNMISDLGGNPIKRHGYRKIGNAYKGFATIGNTNYAVKLISNVPYCVKVYVDSTGELVEQTGTSECLAFYMSGQTKIGVPVGEVNRVFAFQERLYVLCDEAWIEYDTTLSTENIKIVSVTENIAWYKTLVSGVNYLTLKRPHESIIPVVMTMMHPEDGSMVALPENTDITGSTRGVNLLTPFRRVEYCVTPDTANINTFIIPNYSFISPIVSVEVLDRSTFKWYATNSFTVETATTKQCKSPDGKLDLSTEVIPAQITFTTRPYKTITVGDVTRLYFNDDTSTLVPTECPNVRITFAPFTMTSNHETAGVTYYNGYFREDRLNVFESDTSAMFDSRVFSASGVHTYYSRASEPFAIDDNYYFDVDADVMAYAKTSSYLAVISKDTGNNTIYLASGSFNTSLQMTTYSIKASNAGIGAVTSKCLGVINDEPVFLANTGLYGLQTNYLSEKYAINRSGKINRVLCKENNLSSAVGMAFNGYFYIAINGHMYVLDSRHRDTSKNGDSSYECYYFDNLPTITDMFVVSNHMFFMDANYTYTWNDDIQDRYKYLDNAVMNSSTYVWNGTPTKCKWSSVVDGDGYAQYYKVLSKKGTMVTLSPQEQTSCEITLIRDGLDEYYLGKFDGRKFKLSDVAEDAMTRKKVKKYKRLQFVIENNEPEPFGLTSIIKTTTLNNYAKR